MKENSAVNFHLPLRPGRSSSETSFGLNALGLVLSVGVTYWAYRCGVTSYAVLFLVLCGALLASTVALEWGFFPKTSSLALVRLRRPLDWRRVGYRELALVVTLATVGFAYWLFPMFADKAIVTFYFPFLRLLVPILLATSVPYFCLMDRVDPEEEDVLCRLGKSLVTRKAHVTRFELANYVRSWLVKAFWLSVMQPQVIEKFRVFLGYRWSRLAESPMELFLMATVICFAIDLAYAAPGYLLNIKLFNLHTRTAEPTLLGWIAGLFCYWPFCGILFYPYFLKYEPANQWNTLFVTGSAGWWALAVVIVALDLLYALATVAAGVRFSNLTYRGLWNTGLYRYTKHPAYVFKCVSWWFVNIPFVLNSGADAVRCTILLLLMNVVYYLRAKTEERHLSHYPEYVAYALEMNEKSIFRGVARLLPFLRYRQPNPVFGIIQQ